MEGAKERAVKLFVSAEKTVGSFFFQRIVFSNSCTFLYPTLSTYVRFSHCRCTRVWTLHYYQFLPSYHFNESYTDCVYSPIKKCHVLSGDLYKIVKLSLYHTKACVDRYHTEMLLQLCWCDSVSGFRTKTVSYTHLDVYKRQVLYEIHQ